MAQDLIVNVTGSEIRVALMEGRQLVEFYIERTKDRGIVGNIYNGRVARVLPGMQAAFVDIGLERAAFLYVSDIYQSFVGDGGQDDDDEDGPRKGRVPADAHIEDFVKEGQEILVQVSKDPISTKGARLTSHITLPGRYLVFMPTVDHVGISRRIDREKERRRLRDFVEKNKRQGSGYIVRTVCDDQSTKSLKQDMDFLERTWDTVRTRRETSRAPALLHQDLNLTLRAVRDLFTGDVNRMVIDSREEFDAIQSMMDVFMPKMKNQILLHQGPDPIFDAYGVEVEINRALGRKVWLKSGGYLIIDQTEALTSIDVNTGKFTGTTNLEDTSVRTNLEAVKEIVYQLKLRSIGGIIILDFIDMEKEVNRDRVYKALEEALKEDKAKTHALKISKLGLVEMTRKRVRESLTQTLSEPCKYCEGKGFTRSKTTVFFDLLRTVRREVSQAASAGERTAVYITCSADLADYLYGEGFEDLMDMERKLRRRIIITPQRDHHVEHFKVEVR